MSFLRKLLTVWFWYGLETLVAYNVMLGGHCSFYSRRCAAALVDLRRFERLERF